MEKNVNAMDCILPDCWKDDVRMNSLFAPFRKRSVNPLDWDSKLKFWKSLIEKWCFQTKKPVFTLAELTKAFERNGRRALCLPDVVGEILRSGDGCRLCDFERGTVSGAGPSVESNSWLGWAFGLAKKPVSWAVGRLWSDDGPVPVEVPPDEPIVMLPVLKNIADSLLNSSNGELADLDELQKSAESKENMRLALLLLERRGLAATTKCGQKTLIKVMTENSVATSNAPTGSASLSAISEVERSAYILHQDEKFLMKNIEKLEEEKAKIQEEARMYVRKGMRQLAKSSLKKRHALEQCIEKRVTALENVQSLLHRVKEAETDGQVLESYKIGVAALKNTFKEAGLTDENIESTRNELEEVLDLQTDLNSALTDLGKLSVMDEDEKELEEELAELLGQPEEKATPTPPLRKEEEAKENRNWGKDLEKRLKVLTLEDLPSPPDDLPETPPKDHQKSRVLVPEGL